MSRSGNDTKPASAEQVASVLGGLADWLESVRVHVLWQDAELREARRKRRGQLINIALVIISALLAIGLLVAAAYGVFQRPSAP